MKILQAGSSKGGRNLALVTSLFNAELTKKLEQGAMDCLAACGLEPMVRVYVPGAWEIPLAVQSLLKKENCDGVVALGIVIRGETSHYDFICTAVQTGCSQLQLQFKKPVAFGVLTTENFAQAEARCGGSKGNKGFEAAKAALDMLQILDQVKDI